VVIDVQERDLTVVLLEDHDHSVDELHDLGEVKEPDHLGHLFPHTKGKKKK